MAANLLFIVCVHITKTLSSKFVIKSKKVLLNESFFWWGQGGQAGYVFGLMFFTEELYLIIVFQQPCESKMWLGFFFSLNSETGKDHEFRYQEV